MRKKIQKSFISSLQPTNRSSYIERGWMYQQDWAAVHRPDGIPAPMLTAEAQELLRQERGNHDTDHAKTR